ncbi:MAG: GtrA family protein [Rhodospirillales bacterium]
MAAPKSRWSGRGYFLYLIVAAVVGVITVALRELAGRLLPADTPVNYAISVVLAYCVGIVLNYLLQSRFTFRAAPNTARHGGLPPLPWSRPAHRC